jgi:hypothetical protein
MLLKDHYYLQYTRSPESYRYESTLYFKPMYYNYQLLLLSCLASCSQAIFIWPCQTSLSYTENHTKGYFLLVWVSINQYNHELSHSLDMPGSTHLCAVLTTECFTSRVWQPQNEKQVGALAVAPVGMQGSWLSAVLPWDVLFCFPPLQKCQSCKLGKTAMFLWFHFEGRERGLIMIATFSFIPFHRNSSFI